MFSEQALCTGTVNRNNVQVQWTGTVYRYSDQVQCAGTVKRCSELVIWKSTVYSHSEQAQCIGKVNKYSVQVQGTGTVNSAQLQLRFEHKESHYPEQWQLPRQFLCILYLWGSLEHSLINRFPQVKTSNYRQYKNVQSSFERCSTMYWQCNAV